MTIMRVNYRHVCLRISSVPGLDFSVPMCLDPGPETLGPTRDESTSRESGDLEVEGGVEVEEVGKCRVVAPLPDLLLPFLQVKLRYKTEEPVSTPHLYSHLSDP